MPRHSHHFVETYTGFVGFGFNRETDENTVRVYLQKFSDDAFLETLIKRLADKDLSHLFELMSGLVKKYLTEPEYHTLFLKDEPE